MEFLVLAKVGIILDVFIKAGYAVAGGYALKTGYIYIQDYKNYASNEMSDR